MGQAHFARTRRISAAQESGGAHRVVRHADRRSTYQAQGACLGEGVDLGDLKRMRTFEHRQQAAGASSQHRFTDTRRAVKQQVVTAGGHDLDRETRHAEAANFGHVGAVVEPIVELGRLPHRRRLNFDGRLSTKVRHQAGEVVHADHLQAFDQGCLCSDLLGDDDLAKTVACGGVRYDQSPTRRTKLAVERELAPQQAVLERVGGDEFVAGQQGDRDGQVDARAVFAAIARPG